jgi:hypothetical protein
VFRNLPPLPNPLLHKKHGGEGAVQLGFSVQVFKMCCSLSSMFFMEERVGERR